MPAWFYILRLKSGKLYPGATTNLEQRWADHLAGTACQTTRRDRPLALVYREEFPSFREARIRESQIKRWSVQKKEALIASDLDRLRCLAASRETPGPGLSA
jgi:predicted GIY-YIG superfamily endonuclease